MPTQLHITKGQRLFFTMVAGLLALFVLSAFSYPVLAQNRQPSAVPFVSTSDNHPSSGLVVTVNPGQTVYLWGEHSYDNDLLPNNPPALNYGWQCWNTDTTGPQVFTSQSLEPNNTFIAPTVSRKNRILCTLNVGDGELNSEPSNVEIYINALPYAKITADPQTITAGGQSNIYFCANNPLSPYPPFPGPGNACADATSCEVGTTPGGSDVSSVCAAQFFVKPTVTTTYYLTTHSPVGSTTDQVTVTVSSQPVSRILSVNKDGTGTGTVTSNPVGINCGATCSSGYNDGTLVTLSASASTGTFTGWNGEGCSGTGPCQITMNQARNVTATFSAALPGAFVATLTKIACTVPQSFDQVKIDWSVVLGTTQYDVERCGGTGCTSFAFYGQTSGTLTYTDTNPGTTGVLRYRIRSVQSNVYSNIVETVVSQCSAGGTCPAGSDLSLLTYGTSCSVSLGTCWTRQCRVDFQEASQYGWPAWWVQCTNADPTRLPAGGMCVLPQTGTLIYAVTLDGSPWLGLNPLTIQATASPYGPIGCTVANPSGITFPVISPNAQTGNYTLAYCNGGPPNATLANITPNPTQVLSSGDTKTFTFNFTTACTGNCGNSPTADLKIRKLNIGSYGPSVTINAGDQVQLRWDSTNLGSGGQCVSTSFPTDLATSGTTAIAPSGNTTYMVTCSGSNGSASDTASVIVTPPPACTGVCPPTISANPTTVDYAGRSTVTWQLNGNTGCSTSGANGDTLGSNPKTTDNMAGVATNQLYGETKYTLACVNGAGANDDRSASVTIRVRPKFEEI